MKFVYAVLLLLLTDVEINITSFNPPKTKRTIYPQTPAQRKKEGNQQMIDGLINTKKNSAKRAVNAESAPKKEIKKNPQTFAPLHCSFPPLKRKCSNPKQKELYPSSTKGTQRSPRETKTYLPCLSFNDLGTIAPIQARQPIESETLLREECAVQ